MKFVSYCYQNSVKLVFWPEDVHLLELQEIWWVSCLKWHRQGGVLSPIFLFTVHSYWRPFGLSLSMRNRVLFVTGTSTLLVPFDTQMTSLYWHPHPLLFILFIFCHFSQSDIQCRQNSTYSVLPYSWIPFNHAAFSSIVAIFSLWTQLNTLVISFILIFQMMKIYCSCAERSHS